MARESDRLATRRRGLTAQTPKERPAVTGATGTENVKMDTLSQGEPAAAKRLRSDQTLRFANRALPATGLRCIDVRQPQGMGRHWCADNVDLACKAADLDTNNCEMWIAVATFRDGSSRKANNVQAVRSHHLDLDCGNGKPYADQGAALRALKRFCKAIGLPLPLVVNSGHGIHCWWVHAEDLAPNDWKRIADKLKACCRAYGLEQDNSRTGDIASLMRLPGTHNRKREPHIPVTLVADCADTRPEDFEAALEAALAAKGLQMEDDSAELPEGAPARALAANNDDLKAGIRGQWFDYLTGEQKDDCLRDILGQLRHLADAGRETWRDIVAACARSGAPNAFAICREWSATSPKYDPVQFVRDFRSFK